MSPRTAPGGRLVLVDIVWRSASHRSRSSQADADVLRHVWQYDDLHARDEYLADAQEAGFDVVAEQDWSHQVFYPLVSRLRTAVWLQKRGWGRRVLEFVNPQIRTLSETDWPELEKTAEAYRRQRESTIYFAMIAQRR
ncbi:MAG: hypothetical protein QM775_14480 [Pirellulales bacterium]